MTQRLVGIFGGTFNPIHFGHLRVALDVKESLGLHELRLIPCHQPPHREDALSGEHRLAMARLAVANHPEFVIDDCELQRQGPSFTVDTLHALRQQLGAATTLLMILGSDAFLTLPSWHRWSELLDYAHIVVMTRPGWELRPDAELAAWLDAHRLHSLADLRASTQGGVFIQTVTALEISASDIRQRIAERRSVDFLMPDAVIRYIHEQGLYSL